MTLRTPGPRPSAAGTAAQPIIEGPCIQPGRNPNRQPGQSGRALRLIESRLLPYRAQDGDATASAGFGHASASIHDHLRSRASPRK
jgi:hypothetical protein